MSYNDELLDLYVRHQVYLSQLSTSARRRLLAALDASEAELRDTAERAAAALYITGRLTNATDIRTIRVLANADEQLRDIRSRAFAEVRRILEEEALAVARYETGFSQASLAGYPGAGSVVTPPSSSLVGLTASLLFLGNTLGGWVKRVEDRDVARLQGQLRLGATLGDSAQAIGLRLVGRTRLRGTDGATETTRRELVSLGRSTTVAFADAARNLVLSANGDLVSQELYAAILDGHTSPQCRSLHGTVFKVGQGPRPPIHFNCRSDRIPLIDGEPVPVLPSYDTWLKRQGADFQDEVLGPTRGKLFRRGGLALDRFTDRQWRELSLAELATLEGEAFRRAGLDPQAWL